MPFFPETPLDDVKFIDKWTHLVMYGGTCSVLWIEYMRSHKTTGSAVKLFLLAWLAPILMSGLLELLQAYATTTRSGEWLDFAANSLGVTLGAAVGLLLMKTYKDIRLN
jgi:VanZ family protein